MEREPENLQESTRMDAMDESAMPTEKSSSGAKNAVMMILKGMWFCLKLLGRFTLFMINIVFLVKKERDIMRSDSSDVVKMQEMNNLRDTADNAGIMDRDNLHWTNLEQRHKKKL